MKMKQTVKIVERKKRRISNTPSEECYAHIIMMVITYGLCQDPKCARTKPLVV